MKSLLTVEGRRHIRQMLKEWDVYRETGGKTRPPWTPQDEGPLPDVTQYALMGLLNEDATRRKTKRT